MNNPVEFKTIENLAYHLWLERGCPHGSPNEDWFLAERELCKDRVDGMSRSGQAPTDATPISATEALRCPRQTE